jgi:hypothetical protein
MLTIFDRSHAHTCQGQTRREFLREDRKTVERYDTSKLFKLEDATRWHDMKRASNLLGKQMLLARRLCEAGAGFVTVSDCGWDMHANGNSPKNMEGLKWLAPRVDHAVAAFLEDVKQRGLSDRILLVVTGEMGRTPKLNKRTAAASTTAASRR